MKRLAPLSFALCVACIAVQRWKNGTTTHIPLFLQSLLYTVSADSGKEVDVTEPTFSCCHFQHGVNMDASSYNNLWRRRGRDWAISPQFRGSLFILKAGEDGGTDTSRCSRWDNTEVTRERSGQYRPLCAFDHLPFSDGWPITVNSMPSSDCH